MPRKIAQRCLFFALLVTLTACLSGPESQRSGSSGQASQPELLELGRALKGAFPDGLEPGDNAPDWLEIRTRDDRRRASIRFDPKVSSSLARCEAWLNEGAEVRALSVVFHEEIRATDRPKELEASGPCLGLLRGHYRPRYGMGRAHRDGERPLWFVFARQGSAESYVLTESLDPDSILGFVWVEERAGLSAMGIETFAQAQSRLESSQSLDLALRELEEYEKKGLDAQFSGGLAALRERLLVRQSAETERLKEGFDKAWARVKDDWARAGGDRALRRWEIIESLKAANDAASKTSDASAASAQQSRWRELLAERDAEVYARIAAGPGYQALVWERAMFPQSKDMKARDLRAALEKARGFDSRKPATIAAHEEALNALGLPLSTSPPSKGLLAVFQEVLEREQAALSAPEGRRLEPLFVAARQAMSMQTSKDVLRAAEWAEMVKEATRLRPEGATLSQRAQATRAGANLFTRASTRSLVRLTWVLFLESCRREIGSEMYGKLDSLEKAQLWGQACLTLAELFALKDGPRFDQDLTQAWLAMDATKKSYPKGDDRQRVLKNALPLLALMELPMREGDSAQRDFAGAGVRPPELERPLIRWIGLAEASGLQVTRGLEIHGFKPGRYRLSQKEEMLTIEAVNSDPDRSPRRDFGDPWSIQLHETGQFVNAELSKEGQVFSERLAAIEREAEVFANRKAQLDAETSSFQAETAALTRALNEAVRRKGSKLTPTEFEERFGSRSRALRDRGQKLSESENTYNRDSRFFNEKVATYNRDASDYRERSRSDRFAGYFKRRARFEKALAAWHERGLGLYEAELKARGISEGQLAEELAAVRVLFAWSEVPKSSSWPRDARGVDRLRADYYKGEIYRAAKAVEGRQFAMLCWQALNRESPASALSSFEAALFSLIDSFGAEAAQAFIQACPEKEQPGLKSLAVRWRPLKERVAEKAAKKSRD